MSSKIERLILDLTGEKCDEKRCGTLYLHKICLLMSFSVVFSFWTTTLDLIPPALETNGIQYARLDGRLSKTQRSKSLHDFRTIPDIKVLLATLSIAGVR